MFRRTQIVISAVGLHRLSISGDPKVDRTAIYVAQSVMDPR
jgi:hypothetical protein